MRSKLHECADRMPEAGTRIWWVEANRFMGSRRVAGLFDINRTLLEKGVAIESVRAAVHPDDLKVCPPSKTSIDDRSLPIPLPRPPLGRAGSQRSIDRLVQFAGTTVELAPLPKLSPANDRLTEQLLAAPDTARALGEPYRLLLPEMILADIGKTTAHGLDASMTRPAH